jgi:Gti1/Pac2 family transcription factor
METYYGHVRTLADASKLFEACRLGLLPRVQRRLSEKERESIRSGSVFVWGEGETGFRRWKAGKTWSKSSATGSKGSATGSFLPYRETEDKTPDSGRGSGGDADTDGEEPGRHRYKPDGLMKQHFNTNTSGGQRFHLISYYHANSHQLLQPTADPNLRKIVPVEGIYSEPSVMRPQQGQKRQKWTIRARDADGKFPCPQCAKKYGRASELKRHWFRRRHPFFFFPE